MLLNLIQIKFPRSTHLLMCLCLKPLNYKDLLTLPSETDRPGEHFCNFSISNDLTDMV